MISMRTLIIRIASHRFLWDNQDIEQHRRDIRHHHVEIVER